MAAATALLRMPPPLLTPSAPLPPLRAEPASAYSRSSAICRRSAACRIIACVRPLRLLDDVKSLSRRTRSLCPDRTGEPGAAGRTGAALAASGGGLTCSSGDGDASVKPPLPPPALAPAPSDEDDCAKMCGDRETSRETLGKYCSMMRADAGCPDTTGSR